MFLFSSWDKRFNYTTVSFVGLPWSTSLIVSWVTTLWFISHDLDFTRLLHCHWHWQLCVSCRRMFCCLSAGLDLRHKGLFVVEQRHVLYQSSSFHGARARRTLSVWPTFHAWPSSISPNRKRVDLFLHRTLNNRVGICDNANGCFSFMLCSVNLILTLLSTRVWVSEFWV